MSADKVYLYFGFLSQGCALISCKVGRSSGSLDRSHEIKLLASETFEKKRFVKVNFTSFNFIAEVTEEFCTVIFRLETA